MRDNAGANVAARWGKSKIFCGFLWQLHDCAHNFVAVLVDIFENWLNYSANILLFMIFLPIERRVLLWLFVVTPGFFVAAFPARVLRFCTQVMHNASADAGWHFCNRKKRLQNRQVSAAICF